jgi:ferredoxin-NADP reductase
VRCYSISSPPDTKGYLEISVRRQGLVSGTLHATMRAGATLAINRPAGQFVYPGGDDRPIALVAGGIGITPLLSMLRHAVASDPTRPITLLYSARREHDIAFLNELRVLAARHPGEDRHHLTQPVEQPRASAMGCGGQAVSTRSSCGNACRRPRSACTACAARARCWRA